MNYCEACNMSYQNQSITDSANLTDIDTTADLSEGHCCKCKMNYIIKRKKPQHDHKRTSNIILSESHCCKCKVNYITDDEESTSGYFGYNPSSKVEKHCCNCGLVYKYNLMHCCRCKIQYYYKLFHCCECKQLYNEWQLLNALDKGIKQGGKKLKTATIFDTNFEPLNSDDYEKHLSQFIVFDCMKNNGKYLNATQEKADEAEAVEEKAVKAEADDAESDLDPTDYGLCICQFRNVDLDKSDSD